MGWEEEEEDESVTPAATNTGGGSYSTVDWTPSTAGMELS